MCRTASLLFICISLQLVLLSNAQTCYKALVKYQTVTTYTASYRRVAYACGWSGWETCYRSVSTLHTRTTIHAYYSQSAYCCSGSAPPCSDFNVTIVHGPTTIGTGNSFDFSCEASGTTENVTFSVAVVNNSTSTIPDRLTDEPVNNTTRKYSVSPLLPEDNGAALLCHGKLKNSFSANSPSVTLNVLYPPYFEEGQGVMLDIFNESTNFTLSYTIIHGNPVNTTVKLSSSASSQGNVVSVNNTALSTFKITNATLNNTGGYTAIASNSFNSTNLTYSVFVGGPLDPSKLQITCDQSANGIISCKVTDGNSAPTTTLHFEMPGLGLAHDYNFVVGEIPLTNKELSPVFTIPLGSLFAGNYSLQVSGNNGLSTEPVHLYTQSFYLAGKRSITISPVNSPYQTLNSSSSFKFACTAVDENGTVTNPGISLVIPGGDDKLDRVTNVTTDTNITFTFTITSFTDDQTVFVCQFKNSSHTWNSSGLTLTVFYAPRYGHINMSKFSGNNGTDVTFSIELMANPAVKKYSWTLNGKELSNSSNVTVLPGELHFTPLLVNAAGSYFVHDCNNISCNSLDFQYDVYYTPLFTNNTRNQSVLTEIGTGKDRNLTCTVVGSHGPMPLNLNLTTNPTQSNVKNISSNTSITVIITNATNTTDYICLACTGDAYCSYLNYTTYVGGAPDNVIFNSLDVSAVDSNDKYTMMFNANFTDYSKVPVTNLKYVINQTNHSTYIPVQAPMIGESQLVKSTETLQLSELGGGPVFNVDIFAVNDLGSSSMTMRTVTVSVAPTPSPSTNPPSPVNHHAEIIAVAVLVPLAFIVFLIIAGVGGYYYYYKKHKSGKDEELHINPGDTNNASGGNYGST